MMLCDEDGMVAICATCGQIHSPYWPAYKVRWMHERGMGHKVMVMHGSDALMRAESEGHVFVRSTSHRARGKLRAAIGPTQPFFSWDREGTWHSVREADLAAALTITGISRTRKTDDLVCCIDFNGNGGIR